MDPEVEYPKALQRIDELEKRVAQLETRMDNQYYTTQDLLNRLSRLERGTDAGQFVPTRSIMGG